MFKLHKIFEIKYLDIIELKLTSKINNSVVLLWSKLDTHEARNKCSRIQP